MLARMATHGNKVFTAKSRAQVSCSMKTKATSVQRTSQCSRFACAYAPSASRPLPAWPVAPRPPPPRSPSIKLSPILRRAHQGVGSSYYYNPASCVKFQCLVAQAVAAAGADDTSSTGDGHPAAGAQAHHDGIITSHVAKGNADHGAHTPGAGACMSAAWRRCAIPRNHV